MSRGFKGPSNCIPNLLLVAQVLWLCDFVIMWLNDNVTRWLCDCNDLATCLHSFAVSSITKFPTDCSSIERHPVFWGFVWWIVFSCVCVYYSFTQIRSRLVLVVSIPAINWLGRSFNHTEWSSVPAMPQRQGPSSGIKPLAVTIFL